jgi:hypothetical protein
MYSFRFKPVAVFWKFNLKKCTMMAAILNFWSATVGERTIGVKRKFIIKNIRNHWIITTQAVYGTLESCDILCTIVYYRLGLVVEYKQSLMISYEDGLSCDLFLRPCLHTLLKLLVMLYFLKVFFPWLMTRFCTDWPYTKTVSFVILRGVSRQNRKHPFRHL